MNKSQFETIDSNLLATAVGGANCYDDQSVWKGNGARVGGTIAGPLGARAGRWVGGVMRRSVCEQQMPVTYE